MALSPHANFTSSLKRNNDIFPLVQIGGSSTIYLSTRDVTVDSQDYDGRLLATPSITSSIDLRNRTSRTSNITIRIANAGYDVTFGQRTNKSVIIYFATTGTTSAIGECLKVFTGRVIGVSKLTDKEIAVNVEDYASWRFNKILQERVTAVAGYNMRGEKKFKPISYGDFTANSSDESTSGVCASKTLRPVELITHDRDHLYYDEGLNNAGGRAHLYVDGIDKFVPIQQATTATTTKFNTNVIRVSNFDAPDSTKGYFRHTVRLYPNNDALEADTPSSIAANEIVSAANAIDNDQSTIVSLPATFGGLDPRGTFAEYSGTLNGTIKSVRAVIRGRSSAVNGAFVYIRAGDGDTILNEAITSGNGWSPELGDLSADYVDSKKDITTVWGNEAAGVNLNGIIYGYYQDVGSGTQTLEVMEMYLEFTTYIVIDTVNGKSRDQEFPPKLYIGTDGMDLESGYTEVGSSNFTPTEVHENLLQNFGPGSSFIDTTTETSVRANFTDSVRCTIDDSTMTVQDAINKLQKEAGFISYIRPSDGKVYYLIEDATSKSIDKDLTQSMYRNVSFGTIPLSQMLWRVNYNYDKHPAQGTYLTGSFTQDTVTKSLYDFGDNDGVETLNQDWVNQSESGVNLLRLYKYQRITAQCEILDASAWSLEIGDIVTFSDPPADFRLRDSNASYTDYQFRITETTRTVNSLKIKAMEVYKD